MKMKINWGLLGHEWAVELLKGHILCQRARHAYLITGPKGVGRRTLAVSLVQALNCTQLMEHVTPCGECRACRLIGRMEHPDFSVIKSEEPGRAIKVDQIRELQRTLSLAPYEAKFKTALLLCFEEANLNAANALLKTLEEPPSHVIMLLTASDVEGILPTILSRCELIRLRPLAVHQMVTGLQTYWGLSEHQARLIAHLSGGRPGYAYKLSRNPDILEQRQDQLDTLQDLLSMSRIKRFACAEELSKDKVRLHSTFQTWLTFWRDVMLKASGSSTAVTNVDREDEILALTEILDLSRIQEVVIKLERSIQQIDRYVNIRLVTEVFMLDLPYI